MKKKTIISAVCLATMISAAAVQSNVTVAASAVSVEKPSMDLEKLKNQAISEIENEANKKLAEIEKSNASENEKTVAKNGVSNNKSRFSDIIKNAKDKNDIDETKKSALESIAGIKSGMTLKKVEEPMHKEEKLDKENKNRSIDDKVLIKPKSADENKTKETLSEYAKKVKDKVNADNSLSKEQKEEIIKKIDKDLKEKEELLNTPGWNDDVVLQKAKESIDRLAKRNAPSKDDGLTKEQKKAAMDKAVKELTDYANSVKEKINNDYTLTQEEKSQAVKRVDEDLKDKLQLLKDTGWSDPNIVKKIKESIDKVSKVENKTKDLAKKEIDEAVKKQIDEINAEKDVTDNAKAKATEEVKAESEKAKKNIDNAKTSDEVEQEKNDGISEIEGIYPEINEENNQDAPKKGNEDGKMKEKKEPEIKKGEEDNKKNEDKKAKENKSNENKKPEIKKSDEDKKINNDKKPKSDKKVDEGKEEDKKQPKMKKLKDKSDNKHNRQENKPSNENKHSDTEKSGKKQKLPKTSLSSGILGFGLSAVIGAVGAFFTGKKRK